MNNFWLLDVYGSDAWFDVYIYFDFENIEPDGPSPLTAAVLLSVGGLFDGSGIVYLRVNINSLNI